MTHEYDCPECGEEIIGEIFSGEAWCPECKIIWETDWDYVQSDSLGSWITGKILAEEVENYEMYG